MTIVCRFENFTRYMCVDEGAVCYGLEPGVVTTRRSALTYGVEVLNRFDAERHPKSKKIHKDGVDWCTGVFDTFVHANQVWLPVCELTLGPSQRGHG